jgi:hypothetical protein
MMISRRRPILLTLSLLVLVAMVMVALMLETYPIVWHKPEASGPDLAAARHLIRTTVQSPNNHDKLRQIALTAEDLTSIANFALTRKHMDGYATVSIHGTRLELLSAIKLPVNGYYLNIKLIADDDDPQAYVKQLRVGRIALPGIMVRGLAWWLMQVTPLGRYGQIIAPLLREVRIADERLRVTLNWSRESLEQAQTLVTDMASRERMAAYYNRLAEAVSLQEGKRYVSLGSLMQPLFALARERSASTQEAMDENRALILVVAAYVNNRSIAALLPDGTNTARLIKRGVLLNRRIDVAQHFMASATLAISGHRALADMVGMAKEINDTHSGSGFSFIDLAADRAGALFGKEAVKSEADAVRIQELLSKSTDESVFMPSLKGLPENLSPAAFAEQFGDIESSQFQELKKQIEDRITACPLYL